MVATAGRVDGRSARAERTRGAIVEALLALNHEGDLKPTGERTSQGVVLGKPVDHLDALRRGFDATIHDARFVAMANRVGITLDQPMTGDELASLAIRISQTPTSVIERVNRMLSDFRQ